MKESHLEFSLELPGDDMNELDNKTEIKKIFEDFFDKKVKHKFYCYNYIKGFVQIFCTPIYTHMKPYEILNIELHQRSSNPIKMIRRNEDLQKYISQRKLLIEVLFQTLEVSRYQLNQCDVTFLIRYHDPVTKEHVDIDIASENAFNSLKIAGQQSSNPIEDILRFMTKSIYELTKIVQDGKNV